MSETKTKKHPYRKFDEIHLTNSDVKNLREVGWTTKRTDCHAYDTSGNLIPGYISVFVKISEIKKKGPEWILEMSYDDEHRLAITTIQGLRKLAATPEGEHPEETEVLETFKNAVSLLRTAEADLGPIGCVGENRDNNLRKQPGQLPT